MKEIYEQAKEIMKEIPRWTKMTVAGVIISPMILSSAYIVSPSEEGVVTRFGKYNRHAEPGLNFKLPWPFESVYTPAVTEVKRLEIGFRTVDQGPPAQYEKINSESLMLTGDENIVRSEFIVQYKIKNPKEYLFNVKDPDLALRTAAEAAHRQVVGDHSIDMVLTDGKTTIQQLTAENLQRIVDSYKMGVHIVAVQLQDVYAPDEVKDAFDDVASAKEDMVTFINKARGYQNSEIPKVRGLAEQRIQEAEAYKLERINIAKGDADRFNVVMKEYNKAPQITMDRLYIESMKQTYPRLEKILIQDKEGLLKLLDVTKGRNEK